ncbi:MAG: insulinase family protein [Bdellovibrionaceae bacterium]|nr:insulinase family protein [Pseudobdellovibrionaceae bacterium]
MQNYNRLVAKNKKKSNKKKYIFTFIFLFTGVVGASYWINRTFNVATIGVNNTAFLHTSYKKKAITNLTKKTVQNRKLSSAGAILNLNVEKLVLDNGLTVLLYEDHTTPTLLTYIQWVKVGSRYEPKGQTGYAHFFEHLLFKGTKNISSEELEITTSILGGRNNAFTNYDSTVYYMDLSSAQLEWAVRFEAERMEKLILFDPAKRAQAEALINSERGAVTDEKLRGESSIGALMFQSLLKVVYKGSGYGHSIIGSMKDINKSTVEDFQAFYTKYYSPNNIVVAIGGDFNSAQAKKWIKQYYGHIPKNKINSPSFVEPQLVKNTNIFFKDIQKEKQLNNNKYKLKTVLQSQFVMSYPGVFISHNDKPALDLLMSILSGGPAARLDKTIDVQKNLVSSIYAGNYPLDKAGILYFGANILPKSSVKEVLSIIEKEIKNLQVNGVSEEELTISKNRLQMEEVEGLKTVHNKTMGLITAEVLEGNYQHFFTQLDKYNLVTVKDIQKVAKKYLQLSKRVLVQALTSDERVANHKDGQL